MSFSRKTRQFGAAGVESAMPLINDQVSNYTSGSARNAAMGFAQLSTLLMITKSNLRN
jgi:hypothetical protein